jgi:hypothetical protein
MTDRMTDIQRNVSIIEEQAEAIRKTARTMHELIDSISPDGGYAGIRAALEAKVEGVESWAYQIWAESALIRSADEYQQERLAEARAAAEPTAVDVLGDADGVAGVEAIENDDAAEWFNLAAARVDGSMLLRVHRDFILADWPDGNDHLRWVAFAPLDEILKWAEAGEGEQMDAALDPREGEID